MIKPALARGLQLVGATMWDKYWKTNPKDTALERQFQLIQIDKPTVEATRSQRSLQGGRHHGVEMADAGALITAAVYSVLYIANCYLPDNITPAFTVILTLHPSCRIYCV